MNSRYTVTSCLIAAVRLRRSVLRPRGALRMTRRTRQSALSGPRIFYLDAKGRLLTAKPDGSDLRVLLSSGMSGAGWRVRQRSGETDLLDEHGQGQG